MKTFTNILEFIKDFESFTPIAKINELDGNWEVGYGFNFVDGKPVAEDMTMTQEEALEELQQELSNIFDFILGQGILMKGYQLNAIISLLYNTGKKKCPNLLKYCQQDNSELASHEFLNVIYCEDKPVLGLLRRRISEYRLFTDGVYCRFQEGDPITPEELELLLTMNIHNQEAIDMINELEIA